MLSELIVHRGMGGSVQSNERTDSLTKQEISDILKYGAENLFRDDEEGQGWLRSCVLSCSRVVMLVCCHAYVLCVDYWYFVVG